MINIDLKKLSEILVEGIFDRELDSELRKKILDNTSEEQDDIVCRIFNETRKEYFTRDLKLGLKLWVGVK